MKRLQIMIETEMDAALEHEARSRGVSKAALIREYVGDALGAAPSLPPIEEDPLWKMVGVDDFETGDIDDVVYGT